MAKIVLLGDVHFDAKVSSLQFIEFQRKFFQEQLIPFMLLNNITNIIQLGDLFDKRTSINTRALYYAKQMFFNPLYDHNIILDIFLGNHDIFYLNSLEVDTPSLVLDAYDNVNIYKKPYTKIIDSVSFDYIPWICKENYNEVHDFIKQSQSDYCLGHFEISGFAMYKGHIAEEGLSPSLFKKYKHVWSGHYHTRSTQGNISYIGTPMEITWQDCDDPRGFEVFDTETLETTFVKNDYTLYQKVVYNSELEIKSFDFNQLKDKYVKVIIEDKVNIPQYNSFIQKVQEAGCHGVSVVENFEEYSEGVIDEQVDVKDTLNVVNSYIDSIEVKSNKQELKIMMQNLYTMAINASV